MKKMTLRVLIVVALSALTLGASLAQGPSMACCTHGQAMACCNHGQAMACCRK